MAQDIDSAEVHVGAQGRLVIPARLRQALGIRPGQVMVAHAEQGSLVIEPRQRILGRLQERFAGLPDGDSLADELISDRRAEAAKEAKG